MDTLLTILFCHLIGDYVLQIDMIAHSKGTNWYHLLVHCLLYIAPFYLAFGQDYRLWLLLATHIVVDALKARWHKIGYVADQAFHYGIALVLYLL